MEKKNYALTGLIGVLVFVVGLFAQYRLGLVERYLLPNNRHEFSKNASIPQSDVSISNEDVELMDEVLGHLQKEYLEPDKIKEQDLVNGAIQGLTASLGDPYTVYLPPVDNQRSGEDLAGSFFGVGIELGYKDGILAVVAPVKGSPAESANVKAGDLILRVKDEAKGTDEDSSKWALNEAVNAIRGPEGSTVTLNLFRPEEGTEPFDVTLVRGEIVVKSVELAFEESNGKRVAHLSISRFGERTQAEWDEAVAQILAQRSQINGIVLDMRNNPGGFFDGAISIASDFIEDGVVVSQKGRYENQDYSAQGVARLKGIPVEVLVNGGSASASEIVAGALRDRIQAKLIGEKTFGKGTVQDRMEVSNGGGLHITIGQWLLPSGQWIHKEGIPVDVEIKDNYDTEQDEQLLKAIEVI